MKDWIGYHPLQSLGPERGSAGQRSRFSGRGELPQPRRSRGGDPKDPWRPGHHCSRKGPVSPLPENDPRRRRSPGKFPPPSPRTKLRRGQEHLSASPDPRLLRADPGRPHDFREARLRRRSLLSSRQGSPPPAGAGHRESAPSRSGRPGGSRESEHLRRGSWQPRPLADRIVERTERLDSELRSRPGPLAKRVREDSDRLAITEEIDGREFLGALDRLKRACLDALLRQEREKRPDPDYATVPGPDLKAELLPGIVSDQSPLEQ